MWSKRQREQSNYKKYTGRNYKVSKKFNYLAHWFYKVNLETSWLLEQMKNLNNIINHEQKSPGTNTDGDI